MKRLFEVIPGMGKQNPPLYFESKEEAKTNRGNYGTILLGPDHWRFGMKPAKGRTHSHNMRSGGPGTGFKKRVK